ncbi:MAG: hypothetical protein WCO29_03680 [Nostocales cyanobacterium ELA583]
MVEENSEVIDENLLISHLNKAGDKTIKLAAGGGNWSAKEKQTQSDAFCGVIQQIVIKPGTRTPPPTPSSLAGRGLRCTLYDWK